jgi:hypothetical protein
LKKNIQNVAIVAVLICSLSATGLFAFADSVPGSFNGSWVFYSTDMRPVEVSFASIFADDATSTYKTGHLDPKTKLFVEGAPIASVVIPRSYITSFEPYANAKTWHPDFQVKILPDKIIGQNLVVTMAYPNGLPYSVVYETWPKEKPNMNSPSVGVGASELMSKNDQIRALFVQATISAMPFEDARTSQLFDPKFNIGAGKKIENSEGFENYLLLPSSWESYFDNGSDEIRKIDCLSPVKDAQPDQFCEYSFPINSKLIGKLVFIDFRLHGGRNFARERIRMFKKVMCPIFHCDGKALRAADVKGETL